MAEPEATASSSNHHHEEEEDEVVHEIPVYLSTKLAQNLYLFQYPLRVLPFAPGTGPTAARIKQKSQLIEVDLPIDTRAPTYDKGRGDDFASGVSGEKFRTVFDQEDEDDYSGRPKKRTLLDKQTLGSTLIPTKTKYLVGVLKDSELTVVIIAMYCTPKVVGNNPQVFCRGTSCHTADKHCTNAAHTFVY